MKKESKAAPLPDRPPDPPKAGNMKANCPIDDIGPDDGGDAAASQMPI